MATASLLATKFFVPPPRLDLVARPRLLHRLDEGLQPGKRLVLVSAPAGYGKTTLVNSWLHATNTPVAWLSLDESDNDPLCFLQYVAAALRDVIPTISVDVPGMLQGVQSAPTLTVLNLLINGVAEHPTPFVLALDDVHLLHTESVFSILAFLLDHAPPPMHMVFLTRTDPPLPLARLRARNQLVDIRAEHLRFTVDEVAAFLNTALDTRLSAEQIDAMESRTEGWIAALQLAALSMHERADIGSCISAFSGSQSYIMDYLVEEVLKRQAAATRGFLLRTSILDRMCGSLCQVVMSGDSGAGVDSQPMLEALEQMNLFVIPLDNERRWYRYHHLFADVLRKHLEDELPDLAPELYRRASLWYERNGLPQAIEYALKAGDQNRAEQLIAQNGCEALMGGQATTLLKWIEAIEPRAQAHPWLSILKAWALILTGRWGEVEPTLQTAEHLISAFEPALSPHTLTSDIAIMLGTAAAARAHWANIQGRTDLAADFARQALTYLPDDNSFSCGIRGVATAILGDSSHMNGDLEEARVAYMEALRIGQTAGNSHLVAIAFFDLAETLLELGRLHQAAETFADILQKTTEQDGRNSPLAARAYAGLSSVSYAWDDLQTAAQQAQQCVALAQQWEQIDFHVAGYLMLAQVEHAWGHPEQAQEAMRSVERIASGQHLSRGQSIAAQCSLARLWIRQGNLPRAGRLIEERGLAAGDAIIYVRQPEYVVLLRLLLAQGDFDAAVSLSWRLLEKAVATGRTGRAMEMHVLNALACQGRKDTAQALAALERALALAEPEGYVRTFLDEGESMRRLLLQARSHPGAGYAAILLSRLGRTAGAELPPMHMLVEPLTARELEVLQLIDAGCSNQDIAERLVISTATVKRHISTIYAKLGAGSRTQAIALARDLHLFH